MQYLLRNALDVFACLSIHDLWTDIGHRNRLDAERKLKGRDFVVESIFCRVWKEDWIIHIGCKRGRWEDLKPGRRIEQDWEQSGFMPAQKYHCDYCDKQFYDTKKSRERHLQGVSHLRAKKQWFDSFRGAITNFFRLPCAFLICSMDIPFHIKQRCSLLSRST